MKPICVALILLSSLGLSADEPQIEARLRQLRQFPDAERVQATRELAANLVTEGDPGHETLQEVATTLAEALRVQPVASA